MRGFGLVVFVVSMIVVGVIGSLIGRSTLPKQSQAAYGVLDEIKGVLGQPNSRQTMMNQISRDRAFHVGGVHVDNKNRIYVVDAGNNRILGFKDYGGENKNADIVIGQTDFYSGLVNTDNTRYLKPTNKTLAFLPYPYVISVMESPISMQLATNAVGDLFVVDINNNRVLRFDRPFETNNVADDVWGQPDFVSRQPHCGQRGFLPTSSSFCFESANVANGTTGSTYSVGVDVDGAGNLWVADVHNHRVLRFAPGAKTANLVLGQPNFVSNTPRGVNDFRLDKMLKPIAVRVKPSTGEVYVLEAEQAGMNRILVFPANPTNGMLAKREIGRANSQVNEPPDTTNWEFLGDRWVHVTTGLYWARGFVFDPTNRGDVWVQDGANSRMLLFDKFGQMLDVIGQPGFESRGCDGLPGKGYVQKDGTKASLCNNDGEIGVDSKKRLYVGKLYYPKDVARFQLPLVKSRGVAVSDGWLLHGSSGQEWNKVSGRTTQNGYGMAISSQVFPPQLFSSDGQRILVWNNFSALGTFPMADYVIGQDNFETNFDNSGIFGGGNAGVLAVGKGYLWASVSDKIYVFKLPITASGKQYPVVKRLESGNVVWVDDGTRVNFWPSGIYFDERSNSLWVADSQNSRIFRISDPLGEARVDMVLGQRTKAGNKPNGGFDKPSKYTIGNAWGVNMDKYGNLYVIDAKYEGGHNDRVLRFNAKDLASVKPGTIFPNLGAAGLYAKSDWNSKTAGYGEHSPNTPIWVGFDDRNRMLMLTDAYGNRQNERIFTYSSGHEAMEKPLHSRIVPFAMSQGAYAFASPFDGKTIIQDHTWSRILFTSLVDFGSARKPTPTPGPILPPNTPTLVPTVTSTPIPTPYSTPTPTVIRERLFNPGFEIDVNGDQKPDGWNYDQGSFFTTNEMVHGGIFGGGHWSTVDQTYFVRSDKFKVLPSANYRIGAWFGTTLGTVDNSFIATVFVGWYDANGNLVISHDVHSFSGLTNGLFELGDTQIASPSNARYASLGLWFRNTLGGFVFDDVYFNKL